MLFHVLPAHVELDDAIGELHALQPRHAFTKGFAQADAGMRGFVDQGQSAVVDFDATLLHHRVQIHRILCLGSKTSQQEERGHDLPDTHATKLEEGPSPSPTTGTIG